MVAIPHPFSNRFNDKAAKGYPGIFSGMLLSGFIFIEIL